MIIAIGSDHRGYDYKEYIKQTLTTIAWCDYGAFDNERSDYPLFAHRVSKALIAGDASRGILLCGSGVGMAIVANRYSKIYAAVAWNSAVAVQSLQDDNSNILVLPSDYITMQDAVVIIQAWLGATFKEGRYADRIASIDTQE